VTDTGHSVHDDYQLQVQQANGHSRPGTSLGEFYLINRSYSWLNLSGMSTIAENSDGATIKGHEKQEAEILSDCESEFHASFPELSADSDRIRPRARARAARAGATPPSIPLSYPPECTSSSFSSWSSSTRIGYIEKYIVLSDSISNSRESFDTSTFEIRSREHFTAKHAQPAGKDFTTLTLTNSYFAQGSTFPVL